MSKAPERGVTVLAHVQELLEEAEHRVSDARMRFDTGRRPTPKEREEFSRSLAGAVGNLEMVRQWLSAGAPS